MPSTTRAALCCVLLGVYADAHMQMSSPYPMRSKFDPHASYANVDYSMTSPLNPDGSDFPCKGYQNDRPIQPTATFAAGSTYNITLSGSATHLGGSCQLSLSFDNGATFRVIKSMIGACPLTSIYDFTIPSYAPTGNALLSWTWANNEGNREFYHDCAAINVVPGAYKRRSKRQVFKSFDSLPFIWKANLEGVNDCTTTEGEDPVYPAPGPDVVYGNGKSDSDPPSPGTCDWPTPYGQTYKDLGDSTLAPGTSGSPSMTVQSIENQPSSNDSAPATNIITASDALQISVVSTSPSTTAPARYDLVGHVPKLLVPAGDAPTTIVTVECADITVTMTVSVTTYVAASTPPPASTPSANPAPSNTHPPYATGDLIRYLPCVPGTFICTSSSSWETCNYNDGSVKSSEKWVYGSSRPVAAGMECLPYLSPYSGQTTQYGQQSSVQHGSYRDDRIVRARPDGDCSPDGSLQCTSGGQQFSICDQGGWVRMGSVAAGTVCKNGAIVGA